LSAAKTEFRARTTELDAQVNVKAAKKLALDSANTRVDKLDVEVEGLGKKVRALSDDVDQLTAQRNKLALEIDGFSKKDVSARAKAFDDASLKNGPVDSLNTRLADTDQRLRSQQQLLQQGNETLAAKQRDLATAQQKARGAQAEFDSQSARVDRRQAAVDRQDARVTTSRQKRDAQLNTVATARADRTRAQGAVDDLKLTRTNETVRGDLARNRLDGATADAVKIGDVIKSPVKLDSAREEAVSAIKDAITGQIIDRGVDVLTTLVLRAAYDADTAFGFLATGRLGATNTGQSGRAALADAFSKGLITRSEPGRAADIASPQPAAFTYNPGPVQRSFVGVPVAETIDPQFGFDALAALIGKDDQSLIQVGSA
jgi:predicted  nucleic acid-binding Zn-ribbon protein